ncbi:MAG: serine/threonine protein phosphatase [Roseburia sp.]|nr:serine/threonine protein phosphatase [Roseburia sp.]
MKNKIKSLYQRYKHGLPLLAYMILYLTWWGWLEKNVTAHYQIIHMAVDDYIPFWEVFVIPYFLWFAYVSVTVVFFFFKDKIDYCRCLMFLFTGMTLFLIISTLWPNGHHLRMSVMPRDNIFTQWIAALWRTDTPTNLWPSIHVYNALGAHFAIAKSKAFERHKGIRIASLILCISIILSTMLIKQHSMFDVLTALGLAAIMYTLVYRYDLFVAMRGRKKTELQAG